MSRRLTLYLFAGVLGVVSGVYIFKPLFEKNTAIGETCGATGTAEPVQRPQSNTAPREGE